MGGEKGGEGRPGKRGAGEAVEEEEGWVVEGGGGVLGGEGGHVEGRVKDDELVGGYMCREKNLADFSF